MHGNRRGIRTTEFYSKICYFAVGALVGTLAAWDRVFLIANSRSWVSLARLISVKLHLDANNTVAHRVELLQYDATLVCAFAPPSLVHNEEHHEPTF